MASARLFWMSTLLRRSFASMGISACDDIDVLPAPDDFKVFQLQLAIGDAFAGLEIILVAVPWADEVNFVTGKLLPDPTAIGAKDILDLVHDDAFAGRSALMDAQILVRVELALPVKHSDLATLVRHDTSFAVGKLRDFSDKQFRHSGPCFWTNEKYGTERCRAATKRPSQKSEPALP